MDFRLRLGVSDEHTRQRSVRSEQRRLNRKDMPPEGLRRLWLLASLLLSHSPLRGCSFVAPRQKPKATQQMPTHFMNSTLGFLNRAIPNTQTPVINPLRAIPISRWLEIQFSRK